MTAAEARVLRTGARCPDHPMSALAPWGIGAAGIEGVEESPGHRAGFGRGARRLRGKGPPAQRGAHRAGVDADDPWRAGGFDLFGEDLGEPLDPEFRRRVRAPVRAGAPADGVADEHYRRVRHGLEQGQTGGGDEERRSQVDVDGAQPVPRLQVRERREPGKGGGSMHDAMKAPVCLRDAIGQLRVVLGACAGEVHRIDGGRRISCCDDPVVGRLELAHRAAEQYDLGAVSRSAERDAPAKPVSRAGDEHRAVRERAGRGRVVTWDRVSHRTASSGRVANRGAPCGMFRGALRKACIAEALNSLKPC